MIISDEWTKISDDTTIQSDANPIAVQDEEWTKISDDTEVKSEVVPQLSEAESALNNLNTNAPEKKAEDTTTDNSAVSDKNDPQVSASYGHDETPYEGNDDDKPAMPRARIGASATSGWSMNDPAIREAYQYKGQSRPANSEACTLTSQYISKSEMKAIKESFVGQDPLSFIADASQREDIRTRIMSLDMNDLEKQQELDKWSAAAFFSCGKKETFADCYSALPELIENYYGDKVSVQRFVQHMQGIFTGDNSKTLSNFDKTSAMFWKGVNSFDEAFYRWIIQTSGTVAHGYFKNYAKAADAIGLDGVADNLNKIDNAMVEGLKKFRKEFSDDPFSQQLILRPDWVTNPKSFGEVVYQGSVQLLTHIPGLLVDLSIGSINPMLFAAVNGIDGYWQMDDAQPEANNFKKLAFGATIGAINYFVWGKMSKVFTGKMSEKVAREGIANGLKGVFSHFGGQMASSSATVAIDRVAQNATNIIFGNYGDPKENWSFEWLRDKLFEGVAESAVHGAVFGLYGAGKTYRKGREIFEVNTRFQQAVEAQKAHAENMAIELLNKGDIGGFEKGQRQIKNLAAASDVLAKSASISPQEKYLFEYTRDKMREAIANNEGLRNKKIDATSKANPVDQSSAIADLAVQRRRLNIISDAANVTDARNTMAIIAIGEQAIKDNKNQIGLKPKSNPNDPQKHDIDNEEFEVPEDVKERARQAALNQAAKRRLPHNPQDTRDAVNSMAEKFPGTQIVVLNSRTEYPKEVIDEIIRRGYDNNGRLPRAFYFADKVYLDASIVRPSEVGRILFHEIIGHKGFYDVVPQEYRDMISASIWENHQDDPMMQRIVEKYYPNEITADGEEIPRILTEEEQRNCAKEYIAAQAENFAANPAEAPSWWKALLQQIRMWLQKTFGFGLEMNDQETNTMLRRQYKAETASKGKSVSVDANVDFALSPDGRKQYNDIVKRYTNEDGSRKPGWMKAPNGKQTKLTEDQWVTVRTPAFKKWFGDWEEYASVFVNDKIISFADGRKQLQSIVNTNLISADGISASLSRKSIDKIFSGKAIKKSVSTHAHIAAASNIDRLFSIARELEMPEPGKKKGVKYMHRLYTPFVFRDQFLLAKISVKEYNDTKTKNRLYTIEAIDIEEPAGNLASDTSNDANAPTQVLMDKLHQILDNVKSKTANFSKAVDENGEPLVVNQASKPGYQASNPNIYAGSELNNANGTICEENIIYKSNEVPNEKPVSWIKKRCIEYAKNNGIIGQHSSPIGDISISSNSLRDAIGHLGTDIKNNIIAVLPNLLKNSVKIHDEESIDKKSTLLASKVKYNNEYFIVGMVIHEVSKRGRYYDHEMTEIIKDEVTRPDSWTTQPLSASSSSSVIKIIQKHLLSTGFEPRNPSNIDFSLETYSDDDIKDYVDILRPYVRSVMTKTSEEYLAYLKANGCNVDNPEDAHLFAYRAMRKNQEAIRRHAQSVRDDWLYNMIPFYQHMVNFTGGRDFVLVPSDRFEGEEFTGSYIAPEWRKYSDRKGDKLKGAAKEAFRRRRERALRHAVGTRSDEVALYIARETNGDATVIEEELIDFFRNLKKTDLYSRYTEWKREQYEYDYELDRQAMEAYMREEAQKLQDEAVQVWKDAKPVVTEEWIRENKEVFQIIYKQALGKDAPYKVPARDIDLINAAIVQRQAAPQALEAANRMMREAAFEEYRQKLNALRAKVIQAKDDTIALQHEAEHFAKENLPKEERSDFTSRIINLLKYSSQPSKQYPKGHRQYEFSRIMQDIIHKSGEVRKDKAIAEINSMLDSAKMKRNYRGVPVSTLPSEQARVDRIRAIVGMPMPALANIITANNQEMARLDGMEDAVGRIMQLREDNAMIEKFGNLAYAKPEKAEDAAKTLKEIIQGGKSRFREILNDRLERLGEMRKVALRELLGEVKTIDSRKTAESGTDKYLLNNQSLKTLLHEIAGDNGFDQSQIGEFWRRIEKASWGEATGLRRLNEDLNEAMVKIYGIAPDALTGFKHKVELGRALRAMDTVVAKTGVNVETYSRAVNFTAADAKSPDAPEFVEQGRRRVKRTSIPIEDYEYRGKVNAGVRSMLAQAEAQENPVRHWNWKSKQLPKNYLASDDATLPVIQIKNVIPQKGIDHFAYAVNRIADFAGQTFNNDMCDSEFYFSKNNTKKVTSELHHGANPYVMANVINNLPYLFKKSMLGASHVDAKHKRRSVKQIHRFFTVAELDGELHIVKFTCEEFADGQRSLYTISSLEIDDKNKNPQDRNSPILGGLRADGLSPRKLPLTIEYSTIIEKCQIFDNFKSLIFHNGKPIDDVAVEFLRQQLADYDAGLKSSYEFFNNQDDDAAFNQMIEEEKATGKLCLIMADPNEIVGKTEVPLSQASAMQILLTWEQDQYKPGMKWNGWTEESIELLKKFIKPETLKLGYWMRDYIAKQRQALDDKVYERFGAHLPQNDKYWPGKFDVPMSAPQIESELGRGIGTLNINPGFLVARKFHLNPVKMDSSFFGEFLDNQMQQVHFLSWDDTLRDFRGVYMSNKVLNAIRTEKGNNFATALRDRYNTLVCNGSPFGSGIADAFFNKLYKHIIPANIIGNISSGLKQVMGGLAYANNVPLADFAGAMWEVAHMDPEFRRFVRMAKVTDYYKNRIAGGFDRDFINMMSTARSGKSESALGDVLVQLGGSITKYSDLLSTLSWGYSAYRYALKQAKAAGMTDREARQKALDYWARSTDETQQSGYLKDLNAYQTQQGLMRTFTMYLSNPIEVMNLEWQAFKKWKKSTGKQKTQARDELLRRIGINHILVPLAMELITQIMRQGVDALDPDDLNDYLTSMLWGPFEGLMAIGKIGKILTNKLFAVAAGAPVGMKESVGEIPLFSDVQQDINNVVRAIDSYNFDFGNFSDILKAAGDIGITAGYWHNGAGSIGTALRAVGQQGKRLFRLFSEK